MITQILGLAIEFSIRAVFLTLALWIMIKIQKLEWDLLGLLGSVILGSGLDMIPYVGHYLAVPVLFLCLTKFTNGDLFPDVALTVGVGYALVFCMNLFLLGLIMGDLRPSRQQARLARPAVPSAVPSKVSAPSNPKPKTEESAEVKEPKAVAQAPEKISAPAQPQPPANQPSPKSTREIIKDFYVRGIIEDSDKPIATIYSGLRSYTLVTGETRSMETKDGRIRARFDGVRDHQVLLTVAGEQIALSY